MRHELNAHNVVCSACFISYNQHDFLQHMASLEHLNAIVKPDDLIPAAGPFEEAAFEIPPVLFPYLPPPLEEKRPFQLEPHVLQLLRTLARFPLPLEGISAWLQLLTQPTPGRYPFSDVEGLDVFLRAVTQTVSTLSLFLASLSSDLVLSLWCIEPSVLRGVPQVFHAHHFVIDEIEDYPHVTNQRRTKIDDSSFLRQAASEPVLYVQDPQVMVERLLREHWASFLWDTPTIYREGPTGLTRAYGHFITGDMYASALPLLVFSFSYSFFTYSLVFVFLSLVLTCPQGTTACLLTPKVVFQLRKYILLLSATALTALRLLTTDGIQYTLDV